MSSTTNYILHLADDALIMSQRLSEWTGHGPVLEQDIAMTNIALDYMGQARNFYQYAASLLGGNTTEDSLAMLRKEQEFKNHLLVELPNGDWAQSVLKVYFFSAYQKCLMQQLLDCSDEQVRGIAEKSLKEVQYHLRWSREWVTRLGDGTAESHQRLLHALDHTWMFTAELFEQPGYHAGWVNYEEIKFYWREELAQTFTEATLEMPSQSAFQTGGLEGKHTEHIGYLLAEMQYLQRVYPNSQW
ncbi:MAG TPA: 1,2-phenylacetyl-CoA epoxidase subunit PaaC [Phnomibacter sp.]|nr:1,2-phenylacetyl-CoA epoxidase subunit PaaC [Phnomibacter sp.]